MNIKEDGFAILVYGKLSTNIYLKQGNTLKVIWDKEDWRGGKMQVSVMTEELMNTSV